MSDTRLSHDDFIIHVALCLIPGIGGQTLKLLIQAAGSLSGILSASDGLLCSVPRITGKTCHAIRIIDLKRTEQRIQAWQKSGIVLLTWHDEHYPPPLLDISDPPPLLFARGQVGQLTRHWHRALAIVGTREPDEKSEALAEKLASEMAKRGWLIVSGLARGIDAAAHRGAFAVAADSEVVSVAVLGCGVSNIYPRQNLPLAKKLLQQGVIYSEVGPELSPTPSTLMARNRLISGLARATLVIQAGLKSGSMEAARRARQQQRQVITINHPAYVGNQALIRMEAHALPAMIENINLEHFEDFLDNLPIPVRQMPLWASD